MGKDGKKLLVKSKKRKVKKNNSFDESLGVYKFPSKFEKRPIIPKVKDDEILLGKANNRKTKIKKTAESIGDCVSPFEFEKGLKTQKGNDGQKLLIKDKNKKIKEKRTFDELIGACEPSEFEKRLKTQKVAKDGERLLDKAKKRKMKEKKDFDESIGVLKSSPDSEKKPKTQKGKDRERLLGKARKRKINEVITPDESIGACESPSKFEKGPKTEIGKLKKKSNHKKKHLTNAKKSNIEEVQSVVNEGKVDEAKVDEISSVDDDCTRGMKKWLTQYKESRPGLEVLQQRIDEFVMAYEERLEQERKEREARAVEDGWTVVVHHKGRKKTTDTETGTTVGSVASAAVIDKLSKKKSKEIALDFYRFQKREAKRNEVMMLQSKFEQDKKRIQQLRAARKFRPS